MGVKYSILERIRSNLNHKINFRRSVAKQVLNRTLSGRRRRKGGKGRKPSGDQSQSFRNIYQERHKIVETGCTNLDCYIGQSISLLCIHNDKPPGYK